MSSPEGMPLDAGVYAKILEAVHYVISERSEQIKKWGEQNHEPGIWMLILQEELGEFTHDILEDEGDKAMVELVQVTAVALAMLECGLRNGWGKL